MPSVSRNVGDAASACPKCNGARIWKHASPRKGTWRRYCGPCHGASSYQSRLRRRVAYNEQLKVRRQNDPMARAYHLWNSTRGRAHRREIEFTLSRSLVEDALRRGYCAATGLRFDLKQQSKHGGALAPSIDRIDPRLGYTDANCQVVCWLYNRAKGDGDHTDVMMLVEALAHAVCHAKAA